MMAAVDLRDRGVTDATLGVVTPEPEPLRLFGPAAGVAMREMLDARGISLWTGARPLGLRNGLLDVDPGPPLRADAVVSVPTLTGPGLAGLPWSARGFIPVDAHGRVAGTPDVYAAGDATEFPVKQGGSRPSRLTRSPRRSPPTSTSGPSRPRSARSCAGCCSRAERHFTSAPSSPATGRRRRERCAARSRDARCGGRPGRSRAATSRPTSAPHARSSSAPSRCTIAQPPQEQALLLTATRRTALRSSSPSRTRSSATTARRCTRSTRPPRSRGACSPTSGPRAAGAGSARWQRSASRGRRGRRARSRGPRGPPPQACAQKRRGRDVLGAGGVASRLDRNAEEAQAIRCAGADLRCAR